jgi:ribose-phosphate pyrophosphokinase
LAMDLHAAQIQGFFDVPVDHLYAAPVLNNYFRSLDFPSEDLVVISADEGGIKRAVGHAKRFNAPLAIVDKRRLSADTTEGANLIGANVEGRTAIMFDDMISTAGSICSAAEVVHSHGAKAIYAAATPWPAGRAGPGAAAGRPFQGGSWSPIPSPLPQDRMLPNITVLSVASLLGQAIKRIHRNESVSMMFQ